MAAVELTRMDFHVARFMNSDDVDEMSDAEVGQFCLLLFRAWLGAKDCTLPVEEEKLLRHARTTKISPIVLKQFPVVETEWGARRQNLTQIKEWEQAKIRSEAGKVAADRRWGRADEPDAPAMPAHSEGIPSAFIAAVPNPNQPVSTQTVSDHTRTNQTKQTTAIVSTSSWENLRRIHKHIFRKNPTDPNRHKGKYAEACHKHTEDVVLECFRLWAESKKEWVLNDGIQQPLYVFWKALPDLAADQVNAVAQDQEEQKAIEIQKEADRKQTESNEDYIAEQKRKDVEFMRRAPEQNGFNSYDMFPPSYEDHSPAAEEWRRQQLAAGNKGDA